MCTHFCSQWSILGYGTGAFWDVRIKSFAKLETPISHLWEFSLSFVLHLSYQIRSASLYPLFVVWGHEQMVNSITLELPQCCAEVYTVPCRYNVVNFLTNIHKGHPHSLPVRARYGVLFVDSASDWYSASFSVIIYVISYNIGRVITVLVCMYTLHSSFAQMLYLWLWNSALCSQQWLC